MQGGKASRQSDRQGNVVNHHDDSPGCQWPEVTASYDLRATRAAAPAAAADSPGIARRRAGGSGDLG